MRANQEIAGRAAVGIGFALTGESNDHPVIHPGRNPNFHGMWHELIPAALAGLAGRLDELATAMTPGTGGQGHHTDSFSGPHLLLLPGPAAFIASGSLRSRLRPA